MDIKINYRKIAISIGLSGLDITELVPITGEVLTY